MLSLLLMLACRSTSPPPTAPVPVAPATRWAEGPAGIVLEVASDRYRHPDGRTVEVVGTIHVAQPFFYAACTARLDAHAWVLYEGLVDDEGSSEGTPGRVAEAYGLTAQSSVDVERAGWSHADLTTSSLRRRMADAGVDAASIRRVLGHPDDPPPPPLKVAADGPQRALARLALVKQLASAPDDDPVFQRWILDERNRHVLDELAASSATDAALWYGADHVPGLGEALQRDGFAPPERTWVPAIAVGFDELALGPAQVKMLMNREPDAGSVQPPESGAEG